MQIQIPKKCSMCRANNTLKLEGTQPGFVTFECSACDATIYYLADDPALTPSPFVHQITIAAPA